MKHQKNGTTSYSGQQEAPANPVDQTKKQPNQQNRIKKK